MSKLQRSKRNNLKEEVIYKTIIKYIRVFQDLECIITLKIFGHKKINYLEISQYLKKRLLMRLCNSKKNKKSQLRANTKFKNL